MSQSKSEQLQQLQQPQQNLILEGRKNLSVSGVLSIDTCDENQAVIQTVLGELVVTGNKLHITQTNLDIGELSLCGEVSMLKYNKQKTKLGKFVTKLMK